VRLILPDMFRRIVVLIFAAAVLSSTVPQCALGKDTPAVALQHGKVKGCCKAHSADPVSVPDTDNDPADPCQCMASCCRTAAIVIAPPIVLLDEQQIDTLSVILTPSRGIRTHYAIFHPPRV
jgi:hypothetical protein